MRSFSSIPSKYLPPALVSLAFVVTYLFLYMGALPLLADADVPWHIATGTLIRALGGLPTTDTWSYTADGQPWYIISWLWDVLLSFASQLGGAKGVYVFTMLFTALTVASLAYHLLRRGGIGTDAMIFALFMAGLALLDFAVARPHLMGLLMIPWAHLILHESRSDPNMRRLWWLPFMMVLWVNTHASFLAAFTLLGAYGLEAMITRRWDWFKKLVLIGCMCLLALLINPYGIDMYAAVMRTLSSVITRYIAEWLPFVFGNHMGISVWFFVFLLASSLREPTVPLADKIISFAWLLIMMFSARNAAIFVLVSAPYMAINLQRSLERLESIRTQRADIMLYLNRSGMREKMAVLLVAAVVISLIMFEMLRGNAGLTDSAKDPGWAIEFVQKHYPNKRLLNDYNYGGRIIYEAGTTLPVFVDGRAGTAYPERVLSEYLAFLNLDEGWEKIAADYHVEVILVSNTHRFAEAYDSGQYQKNWKRVYRDDVASIFVKR
jgi:hypothetical protein